MDKVLIVGYGNIGRHIYEEFKDIKPDIYDVNIPIYNIVPDKVYDLVFISVNTDKLPDGSCDISNVENVLTKLSSKVIVIKSAIPPGTAEFLSKKISQHIVVSPEYYGLTQHSKRQMDFVILGGAIEDCSAVARIYSRIKPGNFHIYFTNFRTAELAKYMENCFLALKVTFCNEFAKVAQSIGVEYEELRELFILDERMGCSHTWVYPDKPYYDSHCLNKDIPAFIKFSKEFGIEPSLMETVDTINNIAKGKYAS